MIRAAIAGGTGYTGGELLRILLHHPETDVVSVLTTSADGKPVTSVHRDLIGDTDLCFGTELNDPDVLFLCLGHGLSREFIDTHSIGSGCRIIDLGNDFRLDADYAGRHFVYGLTESARGEIRSSGNIANPGCFATAIQLALLPFAANGRLREKARADAVTGAHRGGKNPGETTHFSYRDNNLSIYKLFSHQPLAEIRKNIGSISGSIPTVNLVPFRGDFTRGIFASVYTRAAGGMTEEAYVRLFEEYYSSSPSVFHSAEPVSLKEVVNTNKALLHAELHDGYIHISSVIDNLLKGAAGQDVQNMNLMFSLPEDSGQRLKPSAF